MANLTDTQLMILDNLIYLREISGSCVCQVKSA